MVYGRWFTVRKRNGKKDISNKIAFFLTVNRTPYTVNRVLQY